MAYRPQGDIVGVEFDQAVFTTPIEVTKWLKSHSHYAAILDSKSFRLKSVPRSVDMAKEPRKVWSWTQMTIKPKNLEFDRPEAFVLIKRRGSGGFYEDHELPTPSQQFLQAKQREERKRSARDFKKSERIIAAKEKKKQLQAEKSGEPKKLKRKRPLTDEEKQAKNKKAREARKKKKELEGPPTIPLTDKELEKLLAEDDDDDDLLPNLAPVLTRQDGQSVGASTYLPGDSALL